MMKKALKISAIVVIAFVLVFIVVFLLFKTDLGLPWGYYGDLNIAKSAIKKSECVEWMEPSLVHQDITLENFSLRVRTKSGWDLELDFIYEMNVRQVCEHPKGLLLFRPGKGMQVYSLEYLSKALNEKDAKLENVRDILCHIDELLAIFRSNYENEEIPSTSRDREGFLDYLVMSGGPWNPAESAPLEVSAPKHSETNERSEPGTTGLPLRNMEFETITIDSTGKVKDRRNVQARYYTEDLGNGVTLDMMKIPAGSFLMGTDDAEAARITAELYRYTGGDNRETWHEMPQHKVSVASFYMGKFEVTQAQWKAVAQLPKVRRDIQSNPSRFKGDDLPVDSVSWDNAVEFCNRLSRSTGRIYRLPTEAEWEYACKAGTTTPFHFGDIITTDLANYQGIYPYGSSLWGVHREKTTPVGSFGVPNAFGLYDMHGNVKEMCLDAWHDDYKDAPADGSAWIAGADNDIRVMRGGDFSISPSALRSAYRGPLYGTMNRSYYGGFRVVAVARTP